MCHLWYIGYFEVMQLKISRLEKKIYYYYYYSPPPHVTSFPPPSSSSFLFSKAREEIFM